MAAIRGIGSAFPCPVCLASSEEMPALGGGLEHRSTEKMKQIYDTAEEESTAAERENDLKAAGLRRVEVGHQLVLFSRNSEMADDVPQNAFWSIPFSDPYVILSWDRLHAYHSGLFRKHILKEFLQILEDHATGSGVQRRALSSLFEKQWGFFSLWHIPHTYFSSSSLQDMPRWRDLAHFTHISNFNEYCDGRKYEDLSKVCVTRSFLS